MAIISDRLHISKGPENANVQPLHKHVNVFFAPFLLIIVFILAGGPATPGTSVSIPAIPTLHLLSCNGDTPGFCPNGPFTNM